MHRNAYRARAASARDKHAAPELPRGPREQARWPAADGKLPRLVEAEQAEAEGDGQKVVLDRHLAGAKAGLQATRVEKDEDDHKGEEDGGEQAPVLRALVEGGRVLKDAAAACAHSHEVEPLHDDEVDEVNAMRRAR